MNPYKVGVKQGFLIKPLHQRCRSHWKICFLNTLKLLVGCNPAGWCKISSMTPGINNIFQSEDYEFIVDRLDWNDDKAINEYKSAYVVSRL